MFKSNNRIRRCKQENMSQGGTKQQRKGLETNNTKNTSLENPYGPKSN